MSGAPMAGLMDLPGADIVERGLDDLDAGRDTPEAALVSMAAPRLRALGLSVCAPAESEAGHRLYHLLSEADRASAHSRYNALLGSMASFARAAEHATAR